MLAKRLPLLGLVVFVSVSLDLRAEEAIKILAKNDIQISAKQTELTLVSHDLSILVRSSGHEGVAYKKVSLYSCKMQIRPMNLKRTVKTAAEFYLSNLTPSASNPKLNLNNLIASAKELYNVDLTEKVHSVEEYYKAVEELYGWRGDTLVYHYTLDARSKISDRVYPISCSIRGPLSDGLVTLLEIIQTHSTTFSSAEFDL
ncbi:MAG: hypothetical protein K2X47_15595 [Bdellovibrionales bacterium]|nr:hypothetical protein [Bdellovibrionales bacterium]